MHRGLQVQAVARLYTCDKSEPERQQKALALIDRVTDGVLPWQVACEFIAASRKLQGQGFTPAAAWDRLADFRQLLCTGPSCWRQQGTLWGLDYTIVASTHCRREP